jgi:DnaJ family protein C protein 2
MPGNADTPMKEVRQFYKFWDDFQSWRVFSQYDEYNTDEAHDRYERRYMENENRKISKKHHNAERKRIITLVEFCYDNDPRIIAEDAIIEAEKERVK